MAFDPRGAVATEDMKNRIADGWTVSQLWDRFSIAVSGEGFNYEYAESVALGSNSEVTEEATSGVVSGVLS
ncbi:MAG: hypothetical protein WC054_00435 [Candidatus Nanopelagicales bacterium]